MRFGTALRGVEHGIGAVCSTSEGVSGEVVDAALEGVRLLVRGLEGMLTEPEAREAQLEERRQVARHAEGQAAQAEDGARAAESFATCARLQWSGRGLWRRGGRPPCGWRCRGRRRRYFFGIDRFDEILELGLVDNVLVPTVHVFLLEPHGMRV